MALINCPECGREKVSDSAEACPGCGYGIKVYTEEQQRKKMALEEQQRKLEAVKMPEVPDGKMDSNQKTLLIISIFDILVSFIFIAEIPEVFIFILIVGIIVAGSAISQNKKIQEEKEKNYRLAQENFEEYRKKMVRESDERAARELAKYNAAIKCPHCRSINIKKIKTVDRAMSVKTVGLASGMIGKQYKCKNCKHMW